MKRGRSSLRTVALALIGIAASAIAASTQDEQRARLLADLQRVHALSDAQLAEVSAILSSSRLLGEGNPDVTRHAASSEACKEKLAQGGGIERNARYERICGAPYMAPLYDPARERPEQARACIDQLEFPDVPCAYPVVWVRASEAAALCRAVGKRLCDAHEWEGACAGALEAPDYDFSLARDVPPDEGVRRMRAAHNRARQPEKRWSYGPEYQSGVCAAHSTKSPDCSGGSWAQCGSNTYPTGFFSACRSSLDVYDLHGNAAEHMNLPLRPEQMASQDGAELGYTEMKGSWFIFDRYRAHEDWCRWRAPFWHGSRVTDPNSHRNYHLGFRCCKTLDRETPGPGSGRE